MAFLNFKNPWRMTIFRDKRMQHPSWNQNTWLWPITWNSKLLLRENKSSKYVFSNHGNLKCRIPRISLSMYFMYLQLVFILLDWEAPPHQNLLQNGWGGNSRELDFGEAVTVARMAFSVLSKTFHSEKPHDLVAKFVEASFQQSRNLCRP